MKRARMHSGGYDPVREGIRNQNLDMLNMLTVTAAGGMMAGSYVQAFLLSKGVTAGDYSIISFASTAMSMLAYLLSTLRGHGGGDYFPSLRIYSLLSVVYPLALLLCARLEGAAVFFVVLAATGANSLFAAFKATAGYAVIPRLYPRSQYGPVMAKAGMIGCLLAALISMAASGLMNDGAGTGVYALFFGIAALGMLASAGIVLKYRPLRQEQEASGAGSPAAMDWRYLCARLRDREFALRMLPHVLRGVGMAGFGYLSLVGMTHTHLSPAQSSYLVTVGVVAQLAGNYLILKMSRRFTSGVITLLGMGVQAASLLVVSLIHENVPLLFTILFVSGLAGIVGDTGVPMGVVQSTPVEDLPLVSSLRMLACSGTSCLFILILGRMIGRMTFLAMAISALAYIAAGLLYWRQFTDPLSGREKETGRDR